MATILVLEDSRPAREATVRLLQAEGYQALGVDNVWHALGILETTQVDLVLLDLELRGPGGSAFLEDIQGNPKWHGLPVIVTTGLSFLPDLYLKYRASIRDWMRKAEYSGDQLLSAVRAHLPENSHATQEVC